VEAALSKLRAPVLSIGVASDILYPLYQSQEIVELARAAGVPARSVELDSPHGHDAFLIERDQVGIPLSAFLDDVELSHA
jgi:homoserine O-acetyltransferase